MTTPQVRKPSHCALRCSRLRPSSRSKKSYLCSAVAMLSIRARSPHLPAAVERRASCEAPGVQYQMGKVQTATAFISLSPGGSSGVWCRSLM
ncbi:hypothetical protein BD310DRAFT_937041, partial [Dichomitus squalens]